MRTFTYNWGAKTNGLYCDINNEGQAYNMLLFLKRWKSKKGKIVFSNKSLHTGSILLVKDKPYDKYDNYYYIEEKDRRKYNFRGLSVPQFATKANRIFITVYPNRRKIK